jgi:hypothetical protein
MFPGDDLSDEKTAEKESIDGIISVDLSLFNLTTNCSVQT